MRLPVLSSTPMAFQGRAPKTGTPSRIDDFENLVRPFGITELQRTGLVALPKLSTRDLHREAG